MELTVKIPDDLASRMTAAGGDLSRRALEALALEEFKRGRITKPELRRLLGFGTRYQLDGLLKKGGRWRINVRVNRHTALGGAVTGPDENGGLDAIGRMKVDPQRIRGRSSL